VEAPFLGERPEAVEGLGIELDLGLVAGEALTALRRQQELLSLAAR
jgi:hypothetical protein